MKLKYKKVLVWCVAVFLIAFAVWFWAFPPLSDYFANTARAALDDNKFGVARFELFLSGFFNPRNPVPYFYFGYLNIREGDFLKAKKNLQSSLDKNIQTANPDFYPVNIWRLGLVSAALNQQREAADFYKQYIDLMKDKEPLFITYYRLIFLDFELLNKPEEARDLMKTLMDKKPTAPPLADIQLANMYHLKGRINHYFGKEKEALNDAGEALRHLNVATDYVLYQKALTMRAVYEARSGNLSAAQKDLEAADKIIRNSPGVRCAMASLAVNPEKNYKKAIGIAEPIVETSSGQPGQLGQPSNSPAASCLLIDLTRSYLAIGDKASAQKYFERFKNGLGDYESAFTRQDYDDLAKALSK